MMLVNSQNTKRNQHRLVKYKPNKVNKITKRAKISSKSTINTLEKRTMVLL